MRRRDTRLRRRPVAARATQAFVTALLRRHVTLGRAVEAGDLWLAVLQSLRSTPTAQPRPPASPPRRDPPRPHPIRLTCTILHVRPWSHQGRRGKRPESRLTAPVAREMRKTAAPKSGDTATLVLIHRAATARLVDRAGERSGQNAEIVRAALDGPASRKRLSMGARIAWRVTTRAARPTPDRVARSRRPEARTLEGRMASGGRAAGRTHERPSRPVRSRRATTRGRLSATGIVGAGRRRTGSSFARPVRALLFAPPARRLVASRDSRFLGPTPAKRSSFATEHAGRRLARLAAGLSDLLVTTRPRHAPDGPMTAARRDRRRDPSIPPSASLDSRLVLRGFALSRDRSASTSLAAGHAIAPRRLAAMQHGLIGFAHLAVRRPVPDRSLQPSDASRPAAIDMVPRLATMASRAAAHLVARERTARNQDDAASASWRGRQNPAALDVVVQRSRASEAHPTSFAPTRATPAPSRDPADGLVRAAERRGAPKAEIDAASLRLALARLPSSDMAGLAGRLFEHFERYARRGHERRGTL